ncbi:uncharacterized protein [Montipora foliosa]|uniref:uncharacterized protein n=1 Tax=Montipora foliosa TaxID=591990 RepID=UPI0035F14F19
MTYFLDNQSAGYVLVLKFERDKKVKSSISPGTSDMYLIRLVLICAAKFAIVSVSPCSLIPGTAFYNPTQRTVLAPIVFQGRVLNTTTTDDPSGQLFDACVKVQTVFKTPLEIPSEICFGQFGVQELCLTYVFEGFDYVFFMNSDFTARYDGYPVAALPVKDDLVADVQRGHCLGQESMRQDCEPPKIDNTSFASVRRVQEGSEAVVHCKANGTSPLIVSWYRGEKPISLERQRGNMLTISDATMYDTGRYNCIVKNPAGEASAETYVQILPSRCGAFVVAYDNITFTLQSENYPWPYRKAKSCSWRVCPPQGKKLQFNFTTFDLRTFDKLEIINECDRHRHPWRRYCGSRVTPGYFVSRCNTTCVQIVLDSGILPNRVATGFQATVTTTDQESTEFNIADQICESNLVARVNILFEVDLEIRVQVLEIFKQDEPRFTYEGQEITVKHDFIITDMFGCSLKIRAGKEYYIFASLQKELSDFLDSSPYLMNFVVDPKSTNTPANFQEQLDSMKTNLPRCRPPLLSEP